MYSPMHNKLVNKLLGNTSRDGECLIWHGALASDGYPRINYRGNCNVKVHRLIYMEVQKEDITNLVVRHTCDTPKCINPNHLVKGTVLDNVQDRDTRGRNGRAKININEVRAIRELCSSAKFKQKDIAKMFGIDSRTVSSIHKRTHWTWVD